MITAIDTLGNVYFALAQSNSNSQMMDLFLRGLAKKLDKERLDWKDNTILILDNASYHKTSATLAVLEALGFTVTPVMYAPAGVS